MVPLLQRIGIPSILGYLAAGMALGPYTPGPVVDVEATKALAEFGVVFLLFAIGLELPLARLRTMRRFIFGLGMLQVIVTAALLGGLGMAFGLTAEAALVVGTTLAFSSTATVLMLLVERNEAVSHHGRIGVAVLIFQDLAVVPVLALLPLLAGASLQIGAALGLAAAKAVVAIAGIHLAGRFLVRPIYRQISLTRSPEVFTAANLLLVLALAWLTAQAGMSMALGAFLAGILLADTAYRHQVEADIEPFRGLLLGLFFMTVGMSIDLPFVASRGGTVVLLVVGILAVKASIIVGLCQVLGLGVVHGLRVGFLLAQVGEFAFIVFSRATELGILSHQLGQTLGAAVALSMVLTPLLAVAGHRLAVLAQQRLGQDLLPSSAEVPQQHVIIAGYGRVGRTIAGLVARHGIPYVALDLDPECVAKARAQGLPVYYGDASQIAVLRSVGVERARAVVMTVNRPRTVEKAVARIRHFAPDLPIIARAHDLAQELALDSAGATAVVPETMEASLQMAGLLLKTAGVEPAAVDRSLHEHRREHWGNLDGKDPTR
ncbi:MAG: cation:proton antiporter [Magnetospirillum sp.]|nr:cation:proton antiporter [Magnetospirillum sp.]